MAKSAFAEAGGRVGAVSRINVTDVAGLLVAANPTRRAVVLTNNPTSFAAVAVAPSVAALSVGLPLGVSESVTLETSAALYGSVGFEELASVSVVELYD